MWFCDRKEGEDLQAGAQALIISSVVLACRQCQVSEEHASVCVDYALRYVGSPWNGPWDKFGMCKFVHTYLN